MNVNHNHSLNDGSIFKNWSEDKVHFLFGLGNEDIKFNHRICFTGVYDLMYSDHDN